MKFLFLKNKYDTEKTFAEAYNFCEIDLRAKTENNSSIKSIAKNNAIQTIQALFKPWEEKLKNYKIEYR